MAILDPMADPSTMGILARSPQGVDPMLAFAGQFLANSGPSFQPHSTSSALGHGLQGAQAAMIEAQKIRMLQQQQLAQQQHMAYQNKLLEQQASEHSLNADNERRAQAAMAALPPDATLEQRLAAVTPFLNRRDLAAHADRNATRDNTKQIAFARLSAQAQRDLTDLQFKHRAATSKEEKDHWQQQIDAAKLAFKKQASDIEAGRYTYDTGYVAPQFQGVIPQPAGVQPQPLVQAQVSQNGQPPDIPPSDAPLVPGILAGAAPGAPPTAINVGDYDPSRKVDISGEAQQPVPQPVPQPPYQRAAPNNFDAKDLLAQAAARAAAPQAPIPTSAVAPNQPMGVPMAERRPTVALSPRRREEVEVARQKAEQSMPTMQPDQIASAGASHAAGLPLQQIIPGYRQNDPRRELVRSEAIRQIKAQNPGMTDQQAGEELVNRRIGMAAAGKSVGQLTTMLGATRQAVDQLDFNVDKVTEAMDKLAKGGEMPVDLSPLITAIQRKEEKWTGNPAYAELYYYMHAAAMESARLLQGGQASIAQLHQGAADEAKKWADAQWTTPRQWKEGVAPAMKAEGAERVKTYERAIERQRLGGKAPVTQEPAAAATPPLVQKGGVVDGWEYIGPNSTNKADRANRMNWRKKQ